MKITEALERAARHPVYLATDRTEEHYRAIRERDLVPPTTKVTTMLVAALTCLALAALLVSGKLVDIAERQPLGERRNLWVVGASNLDRASNYLSLNRPYDFILKIRGAGTGAGQQIDSIEAVAVAVGIELGREPSSGTTPRTDESAGGGGCGPIPTGCHTSPRSRPGCCGAGRESRSALDGTGPGSDHYRSGSPYHCQCGAGLSETGPEAAASRPNGHAADAVASLCGR